ncbi:hypothetical protein L3X38_034697 [Prunus dulcis]|uniref:Homeodomain-like superfamily protein n=1 Tax=Prunus dulcis TaxID=3755 RepID=A0AAD4VIJ5_PRUDU|nr:hypothetical protein L3X38_034697 [Prunus dulcis]
MRHSSRFGWDSVSKKFTATEEVWQDYFKSHPSQVHLQRDTFADYEDLVIAIGNGTAAGKNSIGLGDDTDARVYGKEKNPPERFRNRLQRVQPQFPISVIVYTTMASKSVLIVALLFFAPILCLQGTYAYRIVRDAHRIRRDASASASASVPASVVIVALLFCVPILCLQSIYAYRIGRDASASASGAIEGGFENGNWDSQGYGDDEERTAAPRKKRFVWTKPQKVKFLQAITQIGLDNAKPKIIHEFMNEPDLTRKNVASHLQKYRIFLKGKEAAAGDEDKLERLSRSSFARGHPELLFNNNERDQPHSQLLNQQQMETSIGSTFQVQPSAGIGSTPPLTAAASNSHGSIHAPLIRSGQSSLLNNNLANFPRQQPTLGNRNGDQLFFQENRPAAFGMQQPSNNFENGGMSFDPMNNVGLTNNNIGTNNLMQWFCSAGFETGASSASQFPPNFPDNKGDLDQQQNVPVLPPPEGNFNDQCGMPNINVGGGNVENSNRGFMNNTKTVVAPPSLINNNNISHEQESVSDSDISMMRRYLFTDEQGNYQPPSQQEDGGHGQLPYQVEVQDPAANQKYRIFLKEKKAAVGDEDKLERLSRSSFARGHPELLFNNNERDQPHSQLLNQQRMETSIGSTFQVQPSAGIGSTPPLTAAASNSHGSIQFSNDQQFSTSNISRSIPPLIRSGQSSLLNNNLANFLRQQPTPGNRNGDQLFFQENRPATFGMQQPSNNFENGDMSFDPMNNVGLTNNNIGTNNLMQVYPLQSQPGTNNPFSYNLATSVNQNGSNFTPMSSSFDNLGSHFNDVNQFEVYWQSSCSAGFETGASSAYQFPPNFPDNKGDLDQQQNVPVLPPQEGNFNDQCGLPNINVGGGNVENSNRGFMNNTNTVVAPPTLINNNNISQEQESVSDSDISMMRRYLFMDEQGNYQPPSQQQDGGHDQLPYQVEVQDPAANQVPNLSADQVPNPGPYHVEDNAPNETISEPGMPTLFELEGDNTRFSYLSEHTWDGDICEDADILYGVIWDGDFGG